MLANKGDITPPCGVPAKVSRIVPSSITPAFSHWRLSFHTFRSEIPSLTFSVVFLASVARHVLLPRRSPVLLPSLAASAQGVAPAEPVITRLEPPCSSPLGTNP